MDLAFKNSNLKKTLCGVLNTLEKSREMVNKNLLILLLKSKKVRVLFSSHQINFVT